MNYFQTSIIAAFIGNLLFGIFVISAHRKRLANQGFAVLVGVLGLWLAALGFGATAGTEDSVAFWIRQATAMSALIPAALNLVRLTLVHRGERWRVLLRRSLFWLVPYPFIFVLCQTPFFLTGASLPTGENTVAQPVYGPGILVFALYMTVTVIILMVQYARDILRRRGIQRTELQFVLIACILGFLTGVVLHFIGNVTGITEVGLLLPVPVIIMDAVMAYGISTRNIIDVPTFLRRLLGSSLLFVNMCLAYAAAYFAAGFLLPHFLHDRIPADHLFAALVVALLVSPSHGLFHRFAGRVFPGISGVDVMDAMQQAGTVLGSVTTTDELISQFTRMLDSLLGPSRSVFLMLQHDQYIQAQPEPGPFDRSLVLNEDDPVVVALQQGNRCLSTDMLARAGSDPYLLRAGEALSRQGFKIAAGIWSKNHLQGVILLGSRLSGRIYGAIEQKAITGLCGQCGIALENARLYTEVQNSRIYNDLLLERLVCGVVAVNVAGTITVFNREARRITGIDSDDLIGSDISVLPAPLEQGFVQAFHQAGNRDVDVVINTPADQEVPVRYTCANFHGHDGASLGALMVFTDQTEFKKLEYQIRRTDRLASLGTLAAGMAHEIKNPLVSLKTFSQLLPERYEDPDFRETFSALLGDEVLRIDRIVNQLLRFARPAKPSLARINLHTVADNTLNLLKQQMHKHNIQVVRQYRAETDAILGDADMLTQALLNFLLNAIDAVEKEGEIILRTTVVQENTRQLDLWGRPVQRPRLRLSIVDNGRGISREDLLHVFDPFFTTKAAGTGLGLSVSYGIIEEHNGRIDVESEVGLGTTVHLVFPLEPEEVTP